MKKLVVLLIYLLPFFCVAQKNVSVWCFGDSALIDFNDTANIITGTSIIKSRGSCASISDSSGQLLFYSGYDNDIYSIGGPPYQNGEIYNKQHNTMQNGDSIVMLLWYHEVVIIPFPGSDSLFYVFTIGGISSNTMQGIFYSIVDMSLNGGLGGVIKKNTQLKNFKMVDCLTAIKHGNGRDWWIVFRKSDFPNGSNAKYYEYLISPNGISNVKIKTIGSLNSTNSGRITFSNKGDHFVFINYKGLIELYDFDRCNGVITNPKTIYPENSQWPWKSYWSVVYSPNDNFLYVTNIPETANDTSRLYQFNLNAANIAASADTLRETNFMQQMGQLKLAPNGKIYLTTNYYGGYPYSDTTYNYINMNLSVINAPDSLGAACNFTPYSFYLGGKRTYFGLPNNPDYNLGPVIGSGCDTLTAINEQSQQIVVSNLFPNPNNGSFSVNYFLPNGKAGLLQVFSITGQLVYQIPLSVYSYFKYIELQNLPAGVYALRITSGEKTLVKKFIKQ